MAYDLNQFNSTNATTLLDLTTAVNTSSGGIFGIMILVLVFFSLVVGLRQSGVGEGLDNYVASSFITSIIAGMLFLIGLLAWYYMMLPLSLLILLLIVRSMQ